MLAEPRVASFLLVLRGCDIDCRTWILFMLGYSQNLTGTSLSRNNALITLDFRDTFFKRNSLRYCKIWANKEDLVILDFVRLTSLQMLKPKVAPNLSRVRPFPSEMSSRCVPAPGMNNIWIPVEAAWLYSLSLFLSECMCMYVLCVCVCWCIDCPVTSSCCYRYCWGHLCLCCPQVNTLSKWFNITAAAPTLSCHCAVEQGD